MYFKEKEDTNIDKEFESHKKINFQKLKPIILIGGGIVLLLVIILVIIAIVSNSNKNILELKGEEKITINVGEDYIEPGFIAYGKKKKDITDQVKITSNLDTTKEGNYEIVYTVKGKTKIRYITVVKNAETYIYLLGEQSMRIKLGEKYVEPGYGVFDSVDTNLKDKVTVSGSVNTSKKGIYQLTYSVTNSRNVTVTKIRTIVVE